MNRHSRRAQAASSPNGGRPALPTGITKAIATIESLQEFAQVADKLRPFLETAEQLSSRLEEAREALIEAREENSSLVRALEQQRQIFLRMFAQGMGISLAEVLSIEAAVREQLTADANTLPESTASAPEAENPSA
jgi:dsDNA-binding SOS-regulon protein